MALENNLGVQVEKLNPQIQVLGVSRGRARPTRRRSLTALNRGAAARRRRGLQLVGGATAVSTSSNLHGSGGLQQHLRWGGSLLGRRSTGRGARRTTSNNCFNPQLGVGLQRPFNQPLLRNFKIDANRAAAAAPARNQLHGGRPPAAAAHHADRAQRARRVLRPGRRDRRARSRAGARSSCRASRSRTTRPASRSARWRRSTSSSARGGSREQRGSGHHPAGGDRERAGSAPHADHEPVAAGFLDARASTPSEQPVLAPRDIDVDAAIKNALANRTDLQQFKKQMESTDINLKFAARTRSCRRVDLQRALRPDRRRRHAVRSRQRLPPIVIGTAIRSFGDALARRVRQRLQDLERRAERVVSDRHQPGRRGLRAGEAAAAAGADAAREPRDGDHDGGARSGALR